MQVCWWVWQDVDGGMEVPVFRLQEVEVTSPASGPAHTRVTQVSPVDWTH